MSEIVIAADDPRREDVHALLLRHLSFATVHTPPQDVHALDVDALAAPHISFFGARSGGVLLAVGALKTLDDTNAEVKSMHTAQEARGRGLARAMVAHLVDVARARGVRTLWLETGTQAAFAAARALYASVGFTPCGPFADYAPSASSAFMVLSLEREARCGDGKRW